MQDQSRNAPPLTRRSFVVAGSLMAATHTISALAGSASHFSSHPSLADDPHMPTIWLQPPNHGGAGGLPPDFTEMFTTRVAEWSAARQATAVWIVRMTSLVGREAPLQPGFLAEQFIPALSSWGIPLALNVTGATLPGCGTGRRLTVEVEQVQRLLDLGGRVVALSLQSSLSKVGGRTCPGYRRNRDFARRIDGIMRYGAFMRERFPEIGIGLVDAMPAKGWAYEAVYQQLATALAREGLALAFIHLDCPVESAGPRASVVRAAEAFVRDELGIPFGWICVSKEGGATSNVAFRDAVLAGYRGYREAGGRPDRVILTSWYRYPDLMLPEGDDAGAPFTNLVRDFAHLETNRQAFISATPSGTDESP